MAATVEISIERFQQQREKALHHLLRWWVRHMPDRQQGGFYGRYDGHGQLHADAEKGAVLNARILWTFSMAARKSGKRAYGRMAVRAYRYLQRHFMDPEYGGVYWSLRSDGSPLHHKKQVYAQAFALYGLCEYHRWSGQKNSLQQAWRLYQCIEKYAFDRQKNGYFEAYSRDWRLLNDLRLSEKDANEAKTQNTHLHILEAYTSLLEVLQQDPAFEKRAAQVRPRLKNLIELFLYRFLDPASGQIHLFFDENWQLKSTLRSFGHDIEAAWLLHEAAKTLGDPGLLAEVRQAADRIADSVLRLGVEPDGALVNEADAATGFWDRDRIWWVQSEAIVGFYDTWQHTGRAEYLRAALRCWQYTRRYFPDARSGEWFWRVTPEGNGSRQEDIAGFWKCPYHNGRMLGKG
jgi:cellobiose epimerase